MLPAQNSIVRQARRLRSRGRGLEWVIIGFLLVVQLVAAIDGDEPGPADESDSPGAAAER